MGVLIKNKIVPKDAGNPKLIANLKDNENKLVLGAIFGIAKDAKTKVDDRTTTEYSFLTGDFSALPADPAGDEVRSGVLYLPDGIRDIVENALFAPDGSRISDSVQFAFEVSVVKANNAQGYSWAFEPKMKASPNDPLAELRKLVAKPAPTALLVDETGTQELTIETKKSK
jgi:hypothetical protein